MQSESNWKAKVKPVASLLKALLVLFSTSLLLSPVGVACSLFNVQTSIEEALVTSAYYWVAAVVVGAAIIGLEIYQRRWVLLLVAAAMIALHPRWTVRPNYRPDCTFVNVEASQAVLAFLLAVLTYRIMRTLIAKRGKRRSSVRS